MAEFLDTRALTALGHFATAISFVLGIYVYRRKTNTQVFLEFTRRYDEVMRSFPVDARRARLHSGGEPPAVSDEISDAALRYLNLCSEEFYLWKRRYLSGDIWRIWESELKRTLASPLYRREWTRLRDEFSSFPEFAAYVEEVQREG